MCYDLVENCTVILLLGTVRIPNVEIVLCNVDF